MKPYYHDEKAGITIYNGDCREILPSLPPVDLILTDPPYGINLDTAYRQRGRGRLAKCRDFGDIHGDDKPFDPSFLFPFGKRFVLWGSNYFSRHLDSSSGWLVWDKRVLEITNDQADGELAWTNCVKGVRIFRHMWNGFLRDSERGEGYHPTQKPVALMHWCIDLTNPKSILDPFMGSGPLAVASKEKAIPYVGIEIEEKYCEIAAKRLSQEVFDFKETA